MRLTETTGRATGPAIWQYLRVTGRRRIHKSPRSLWLLAAAIGAFLVAAAAPASAQDEDDGLRVETTSTYRVLPEEGLVEVEIEYTLTNEVPNRRDGFYIRSFYFANILVIIPETATDLRAVLPNGRDLTMRPTDDAEDVESMVEFGLVRWDISLGGRLNFGRTREFTLTYVIPDGPPRDPDAWARVNSAFVAVIPIIDGDPGLASVRVEMPRTFKTLTLGDPMELIVEENTVILEATEIEDPLNWFALVFGTSESGLQRSTVAIDESESSFGLASWPGDSEWEAFVRGGIVDGVPLLEQAIGVNWPLEGTLEVVETVAPSLSGYAGVYYEPLGYRSDATIEVGEDLDLQTLVHELSHAWFNSDFSEMRWFTEGLAETISQHVAEEIEPGSALPFDEVNRSDPVAVPLLEWELSEVFGGDDPLEVYGYSASYQVVSDIVDEIGFNDLAEVLALLWESDNPYKPAIADPGDESVDWRDALDAFEIVGGSVKAAELFDDWVIDVEMSGEIAARDDARHLLRQLSDRDASWSTPDVVPLLMADWKFEQANTVIRQINSLLDRVEDIDAQASGLGLSLPVAPQLAFEAVTEPLGSFDRVLSALDDQEAALTAVLAARERVEQPTKFLEDVGLYGTDIDADLQQIDDAFETSKYDLAVERSDELVDLLNRSSSVGTLRLELAGGALVALLTIIGGLVWGLRRRRRKRREVRSTNETGKSKMRYADGPTVAVSIEIEALSEVVWKFVSDIETPVGFSRELQAAEWISPHDGPSVGARFKGTNIHPAVGEWSVECEVVECDPSDGFAWTPMNDTTAMALWKFSLEPDGDSTTLTFSARLGPAPSGLTIAIEARPEAEEQIVASRLEEWRVNMQATIEGIKELAERP